MATWTPATRVPTGPKPQYVGFRGSKCGEFSGLSGRRNIGATYIIVDNTGFPYNFVALAQLAKALAVNRVFFDLVTEYSLSRIQELRGASAVSSSSLQRILDQVLLISLDGGCQ